MPPQGALSPAGRPVSRHLQCQSRISRENGPLWAHNGRPFRLNALVGGIVPQARPRRRRQGPGVTPQCLKKKPALGKAGFRSRSWLRGTDSNRRPSGYEPDELPLLHPATANSSDLPDFCLRPVNSRPAHVDVRNDLATGADDQTDSIRGDVVREASSQNSLAVRWLAGMRQRGDL